MESEKSSDLEENDKQDIYVTDKELVADIKSKVDLSNILDVSLQGQDFSNGLNAEVDLDESVDKVDDLTDKSDELDGDGNDQSDNETFLNSHGKDSGNVNEKDNSNENRDIVEGSNPNEVEYQEDHSAEDNNSESFHDNRNLNDTVVTEANMGNNLEGKEGVETSVKDSCENLSHSDKICVVKREDEESNGDLDKLDNNNKKETQDYENLNLVPDGGHSDNHQTSHAQDAETAFDTNEEKTETKKNEEKLHCETDVDTGDEASGEGEKCENKEDECLEPREAEGQKRDLEPETALETDSIREESAVDFGQKENVDRNDEDGEIIKEEIIDREKIQNFIKEVINDLQGIVIETENCDSVVNDMFEESTRSELISDSEVKDEENEKVIPTEVTETSDNSKPTEVTEILNEIATDNYDETSDTLKMDDIEAEPACELVIKEIADVTDSSENSVSVAEYTPKSDEETTNEDNKTCETDTEKSDALMDSCDPHLQNTNHFEGDYKPNVEEQHIDEPTQNSLPVTRKETDLKMVEEELKATKAALQKSQRYLQDERSKHNRDVMTLKLQLYRSQMELKQQKSKSEKQLAEIMSHLVMLESRLRQEQLRLKRETRDKNSLIVSQNKEIVKLKDQNEQLLNAIKEICAKGGMNGYMRENRRRNGNSVDGFENSAKGNRDKKSIATGKLGSMKDKFMAKNRSSLELNSFSLEKYLIKDERLCSSQEDLHRLGDERRRSIPTINERMTQNQRHESSPKDRPISDNSEYKNGSHKKHVRYSQNFFSDIGSPKHEMNKSVSESSHLSESTNSSSGVYSLSDHDLSMHNDSITNGHHGSHDFIVDDDDDDDRIFSFSSTHINTVIAEEEAMGPMMSHSGQMMSMGSMPMLANLKEENMGSGKNRPHSLSSVDLASIQQQAQNLSRLENRTSPVSTNVTEKSTPPTSPSYIHSKNELTPFQTFKTMFRRKGSSKNKGHKKRSVSLSQTTNTEYSEALKKHFQKYDMS